MASPPSILRGCPNASCSVFLKDKGTILNLWAKAHIGCSASKTVRNERAANYASLLLWGEAGALLRPDLFDFSQSTVPNLGKPVFGWHKEPGRIRDVAGKLNGQRLDLVGALRLMGTETSRRDLRCAATFRRRRKMHG